MHRSCIDRVLFAISSRRSLIFSSTDYDDLELALGISVAACTHFPLHTLRAEASVGTESARRVVFARVRRQVPGSSLDPYGLRVHM